MRLHIGATRHQLAAPNTSALRTDAWVHLGAPESIEQQQSDESSRDGQSGYVSFYFTKDDSLPFPDDHFTFAFSEHFFEHLFLNEAASLLGECHRVLQPGACLRIAVPDADLRTYMDPEPIGFTTGDHRWFHPDKHKSRWSIYSLSCLLELVGFRTRGVVYCDKFGTHLIHPPTADTAFYGNNCDSDIIFRTDYICRFRDSLIVDAIKC